MTRLTEKISNIPNSFFAKVFLADIPIAAPAIQTGNNVIKLEKQTK